MPAAARDARSAVIDLSAACEAGGMTASASTLRAPGPVSSGPGSVDSRLPFTVDSWCAEGGRPGFLSHAHGDHTQGIAAWANGPGRELFCSHDTWRLVCFKVPELAVAADLGAVQVVQLEDGESCTACWGNERFEVTAVDANHCQGAVMFIFQGSFGSVLHTGDCRLTHAMTGRLKEHLSHRGISQLDLVYLDCTFASFPRDFPSIAEATRHVKDIIHNPWEHARVYLACEGLGTEPLLRAIASKWQLPIYVPDHTSKGVAFHGENSPKTRRTELRLLLDQWMLTEDPHSTPFHICGGRELHSPAKKMIRAAKLQWRKQPIFIRPSVQAFNIEHSSNTAAPVKAREGTVYKAPSAAEFKSGVNHVLYSNHSSFLELCDALATLAPRLMVPHSFDVDKELHPDLRFWAGTGDVSQVLELKAADATGVSLIRSSEFHKKRKLSQNLQLSADCGRIVPSSLSNSGSPVVADQLLQGTAAWLPPLEEYEECCVTTQDGRRDPSPCRPCGPDGSSEYCIQGESMHGVIADVVDRRTINEEVEASSLPKNTSSEHLGGYVLQDEPAAHDNPSVSPGSRAGLELVWNTRLDSECGIAASEGAGGSGVRDLVARALGIELPPIVSWKE